MTMVCGLDLHRRQITFDALEMESGEVWTGKVWQPDRKRFRRWLRQDVADRANGGPVSIAVEGCTGWRYVVEEVVAAGFDAHLAEPADTQAARGRKRHAKTDRSDSRLLRELLADGRLPASWIPPAIVLEWRERIRLYKTLVDERSTWVQRIHAELYQHGVALPETSIRWAQTRAMLEADDVELSPAGRQRVLTAYRMIDAITVESRPLKADLQRFGRHQPGCRALADSQYGTVGCWRWRCGPSSATANASPVPNK
jgi:transposase